MTKYLRLYAALLLFVASASCTGQSKTEQVPQDEKIEQKSNRVDPYFVETEGDESPYGPKSITRNMLQDRQGYIWLATWEGILRYDGQSFVNFTNKEKLARFHVFTLMEDRNGNLWFGTVRAGVYRYDGEKFTHFTKEDGLVDDLIGCFYEDQDGHIWIGTGAGISVYDGTSFRNFTKEDGLIDDDINAIIQDSNGKFWIGARGEASYYDGKAFSKITNDLGEAFVNTRTIIKDSKGNIWLGGNGGLWRYDGSNYLNLDKSFIGHIYEDRSGNIWTNSESLENRRKWLLSRYNSSVLLLQATHATQVHEEEGMLFGILEDNKGGIWFGSLQGVGRYDGSQLERFREPGGQD